MMQNIKYCCMLISCCLTTPVSDKYDICPLTMPQNTAYISWLFKLCLFYTLLVLLLYLDRLIQITK